MNEQQVNALLAAIQAQTTAQQEQTAAINRLVDSNEMLCNLIVQTLADDDFDSQPVINTTYLSGAPRG